jgi:RNA polymerase sigma-70 factor, ECF subfamily
VLLERARAGDAAALDGLVARHLTAVYQVALRVLGDGDLAEDAAQETWVLALRGLARFRGESSFRTWVMRIALNTSRSALRRRGRRRETVLDVARQVSTGTTLPDAAVGLQVEAQRLDAVLEQLPTKQRLAVTLRIYQGLSHREVGEVLDCSEASARVNFHHGIKRLRELLE